MKRIGALCILLILMMPLLATAYVPSERHGAIELKFGPHRPNVGMLNVNDAAYEYGTFFGEHENMLRAILEIDWQFARVDEVVSFGLGVSFGFMREEAKGFVESDAGGLERSSDTTALNVMPMAVLGVIRLDVLQEKLAIPFVPFFKAGLNWYPWWTKTGGERDNSGGSLGWQVNPGIAFLLDWIDETTARTFDNEVGVNNSYIFFELLYARVNGFGDDGKLNLSPTNIGKSATWMAGLCLEF